MTKLLWYCLSLACDLAALSIFLFALLIPERDAAMWIAVAGAGLLLCAGILSMPEP